MKKFVAVLFVAAIFGLLSAFVPVPTSSGQERVKKFERAEQPIADSYIVVLEDWAAGARGEDSRSDEVAEELAIVYQGRVDRVYRHALNGFSIKMNAKQAEALSRDPRVKFIEEDGIVTKQQTTQTNATWGLDRIDQRDRPLNGTYVYENNGSGVRAYILDTGILASHNQFGGRVTGGYTAINDGRGTTDCDGHGTHVAGTVGGSVHGVAKGVTLVPVRVLDCNGSGTISGVVAGVDWVTANHVKPAVANMSLGGGASSTLDNAVSNSIAAGVTYAVAAGNDNRNACNYSPARVASALTVGATTSTDARASYSNFGNCVNIFAPGSSITSTWYTSTTATASLSGTSMASPHVAGVAALYLNANNGASPATVNSAIIGNASVNKLSSIGTGSPNLLLYSLFGGGGGPEPTPEPSPTVSPEPSPTPSSITLTVTMTKQQGINRANLSWSGATASADVFRNNGKITTVTGTSYVDNLGRGGGTVTYKVCNAGTTTCSESVTRSY